MLFLDPADFNGMDKTLEFFSKISSFAFRRKKRFEMPSNIPKISMKRIESKNKMLLYEGCKGLLINVISVSCGCGVDQ